MRKIAPILSVAALTLSALTACGSDDANGPGVSAPPTSAGSSPATSSSSANTRTGPGTFRYSNGDGATVTAVLPAPASVPAVRLLMAFAKRAGGEYSRFAVVQLTLDNRSGDELGLNNFRAITTDRQQLDVVGPVNLANDAYDNGDAAAKRALDTYGDRLNALRDRFPEILSPGARGTVYFAIPGATAADVAQLLAPTDIGPATDFEPMQRVS